MAPPALRAVARCLAQLNTYLSAGVAIRARASELADRCEAGTYPATYRPEDAEIFRLLADWPAETVVRHAIEAENVGAPPDARAGHSAVFLRPCAHPDRLDDLLAVLEQMEKTPALLDTGLGQRNVMDAVRYYLTGVAV